MHSVDKQRTIPQNSAMHLYFRWVAEALNDAGLDMRAVLKPNVDIPWTEQSVKDFMWRPIQKLMLRKESTTNLTKQEVSLVYDVMHRHIAKHGINIEFPSEEQLQIFMIKHEEELAG